MIMGVNGRIYFISAYIYYGQWCYGKGGELYYKAMAGATGWHLRRTYHGFIGIALLHWVARISPKELYTLDIEVDLRSPSRRKWLEKMGLSTGQTGADCKLAT